MTISTLIKCVKSPVIILTVCALLLLPLTEFAGLTTTTASEILIYAIAALGFNLLLGYTGLVSFGHGIFFGVAAYAASIIQVQLMPEFIIPPMILSVVFTTLVGAGIGFLSLRLSGVYFSLLTLSFAAMTFYIIYRWTSFTGGEDGYGGMQRTSLFGVNLDDQTAFFYLILVVFILAVFLLWRVVNSPFGSVLKGIRENSQRASFIGYDVRKYRLIAFTLSAFFVGIAGSMFPFLKYYIGAELVHVHHSGEILALTILGGSRHFIGPALGALFFILFRELLSEYTASWQLLFGLMFMGFVLFSPKGLMGLGEVLLAPLLKKKGKAAMTARVMPAMTREVPACLRNLEHPVAEQPIFECRDVAKYFGNFSAVDGVSLSVKDKSLQALIGPNGAGKTSLFNLLSGEYQRDKGGLYFLGQELTDTTPEALSRQGIARSFQITNVFPELPVVENIRLAVQSRHPQAMNLWTNALSFDSVNRNTSELIEFLGLKGLEEIVASDLSYGGQRLLEIGLAVATQPRVLLLDEPLVGLAAQERERIIALIKSLAEFTAVLLIEHDIDRVFEFSDHVTVMNQAKVLVSGTPDEMRNDEQVQVAYLGSGNALIARQSSDNLTRQINPKDILLNVEGIDTFYGKSHILNDVSFNVCKGEVVALLGRNGAGKSSTLKSVMGIAPISKGRITFNGKEIQDMSPEQVACLGIGLVPQGRRLFANLTVEENLNVGGLRRTGTDGVTWSRERIFEQFPRIKERLHSRADTLSGGEQQMVAIARALSGNVQMILMDEPFEGLSPTMIEELFKSINSLRNEVSVVIIEHQLDLVLALADRAFILDRGSISHEGPTKPLLDDLAYRKEKLWV
jgi:branched-chain amino acid transport system ATP-binding protein